MQINKFVLTKFFLLFVWYVGYGQHDTNVYILKHRGFDKPVFYIIDGLKISQKKFTEIKLNFNSVKRLNVEKKKVKLKSK